MKNLIIILAIIFLCFPSFSHDVELRFVENRVEGELIFVDIDIRASSYDFNLASHNIRAYYDHNALELVDVTSQLPENKYNLPNVDQSFTDGLEVNIGALSFEDHMGFINMSVILSDLANGGIDISTEWVTIHTASFKVINSNKIASLVWAMEDVTEQYATAFVEVAEWLSPNQFKAKNVFDLRNFEQQIELNKMNSEVIDITVGPNPTRSYVNVNQPSEDATLSIIDMTGAILKEMKINSGTTRVDLNNFSSGSYIFFIQNEEIAHTEQILIAE